MMDQSPFGKVQSGRSGDRDGYIRQRGYIEVNCALLQRSLRCRRPRAGARRHADGRIPWVALVGTRPRLQNCVTRASFSRGPVSKDRSDGDVVGDAPIAGASVIPEHRIPAVRRRRLHTKWLFALFRPCARRRTYQRIPVGCRPCFT